MKKPLKYALIGLGGLAGLFIVALTVIALTFDPNDYKDEVARAVKERTGRELTIHGDLELALFPWLAVRTDAIELGNATGFGPAPFARVAGLDVRVRLIPLLFKRVEVGAVVVRGLSVDLARDASGRDNWSDLTDRADRPDTGEAEQRDGLEVDVGEIRIDDAALTFTDAQASRQYRIERLNIVTGAVRPGAPIEVAAGFEAHATNPSLDAALDFKGTVVPSGGEAPAEVRDASGVVRASGAMLPLELADARYSWTRVAHDAAGDRLVLEGFVAEAFGARFALDAEASALSAADAPTAVIGSVSVPAFAPSPAFLEYLSARLPSGADASALAPLAMSARFKYRPATQELELSELAAQALGLSVIGRATGLQVLDAPQLAGHVAVAEFAPRRVLAALGTPPPDTADPDALGRMSVDADFSYAPNAARLERFVIGLDGAKLTGNASIDDIAKRALRFDVTVDALDLDRYLPPTAVAAADQAQEGALDQFEVPAELIRKLDVIGTLRAGRLTLSRVKAEELRVTVTAREAELAIAPLGAKLYGGSVNGSLAVDARRGEPSSRLELGLEGVQLAGLLKDAFDSSLLSGGAQFNASLAGRGRTVGEMRRSLSGSLKFSVADGALEGVDLWYEIRSGWAKLRGRAVPAAPARPRTVFEQLSGSATVADGVLTNNDLVAAVPYLRVKGEGKVDLVEEAIRYRATATVVGAPNFGPGEDLSELAGLTLPVTISGKFSALKASPDLTGALKGTARKKIDEKKQEAVDKAKEKLKKKLGDLIR